MEYYQKEFIKEQWFTLKQQPIVLMSWGISNIRAGEYNEMPSLLFKVNGFVHQGEVVIAYNQGSDLYEVYCLNNDLQPIQSREDVYFDELVDAVDRMVEKDCGAEQYGQQVEQFLTKQQ